MDSPKEIYQRSIAARKIKLKPLVNDIRSDILCPGEDYVCLLRELKNFETKSVSDAQGMFLAIFMYYFKVKTKAQNVGCDAACLMVHTAKLADAAIDYLNSVSFTKFSLYDEQKSEVLESRLLRYEEDENFFKFLRKATPKIRSMVLTIDSRKILDSEEKLKVEVSKFNKEMEELERGLILRGCDIALLDDKGQMYHFYLQTFKDPDRKDEFIKSHTQLQLNLARK